MGFFDSKITPRPGKHYYYLRATQQDGERAWSSPVWLKCCCGGGGFTDRNRHRNKYPWESP